MQRLDVWTLGHQTSFTNAKFSSIWPIVLIMAYLVWQHADNSWISTKYNTVYLRKMSSLGKMSYNNLATV